MDMKISVVLMVYENVSVTLEMYYFKGSFCLFYFISCFFFISCCGPVLYLLHIKKNIHFSHDFLVLWGLVQKLSECCVSIDLSL